MSDRSDSAYSPADRQRSGPEHEAAAWESSRMIKVGERAEFLETRRTAAAGVRVGLSDPDAFISVTVMVKSRASEDEMNQTLSGITSGQQKPLTDTEFSARFGADLQSMKRVEKFAQASGLQVQSADSRSGQIKLAGTVRDFSKAFAVQLDDYRDGIAIIRERRGNISVPANLAADVEGVFGLDTRRQGESHLKRPPVLNAGSGSAGYLPNEVADVYNFPRQSMGAGQSVGIIELGGGIFPIENSKYYKDHGLKEPSLQIVGVDGSSNSPGADADAEVALDVQIIGAVAPDANQQLIFAPNSELGFIDAVTRATFPQPGELQNTAISISWGKPESSWSEQSIRNMNTAFKKAALKGISVFAAAGDSGARDGTDKFTTDYPSSDPYVTGCGGSSLPRGLREVVWNDGEDVGVTGGGISQRFELPDFQKDTRLPENANREGKSGRGAPDVAGNASPLTGYRVRVGGFDQVTGGTSAVAPLYAGLTMRINGALGHPVGYLNPFLYRHGTSGIFRDITDGNNGGYTALPGWDACTGWGSINGQKLLDLLKLQGISQGDSY
jgi:kumamolisin